MRLTEPETLPDLHDATLVGLELQWSQGTVVVTVRTAAGPVELAMSNITQLQCTRTMPWGASVSIDKARIVSLAPDSSSTVFELVIEIQSGDHIRIIGRAIVVRPCNA